MEITKGQEFSLEIDDMGTDGEGIGHKEGYTLFVKDALVGDIVRVKVIKAKKKFGYGRLLEVIKPSPWRVEPACDCARQCGGCQIQHCSYEKQLAWKEKKVRDCLQRIGGFEEIPMEPIMGMDEPYHYRNKAQYPVGYDKEGNPVAGFYAGRTHSIIPNTDCAIQHPCNHMILETILAFMKQYDIPAYEEKKHTGLVRHILTRVGKYTGEVMVCLIINGNKLPHQDKLVEMLKKATDVETTYKIKSICLNINKDKTNRILGEKVVPIYGQTYIEDRIGNITYRISPLSFYQVNPKQTEMLYRKALSYAALTGRETVLDAYCGTGTIGMIASDSAKQVIGVELNPDAVRDARNNAKGNGIKNITFYQNDAGKFLLEMADQGAKLDVLLMDPPRSGSSEAFLSAVSRMKPGKIVYISCNPETLVRDLKYLVKNGYQVEKSVAVDMFPFTESCEAVCLLTKKERKFGCSDAVGELSEIAQGNVTGTKKSCRKAGRDFQTACTGH